MYGGGHAATTYAVANAGGHLHATVWVESFSTNELAFRSSGGGGSQAGSQADGGDAEEGGGLVDVEAPGPALPLLGVALLGVAVALRRR